MKTKSEKVIASLNKLMREYFRKDWIAYLDEKRFRVYLVDSEMNEILSLGANDGTRETCSYRQNTLTGDITNYSVTAELVSTFLVNGHAALVNLQYEKKPC